MHPPFCSAGLECKCEKRVWRVFFAVTRPVFHWVGGAGFFLVPPPFTVQREKLCLCCSPQVQLLVRHRTTMAARSLGRVARLKPAVSHRCTVPVLGRVGAASNSHRDSREDDRYTTALVSQSRNIHVTRRSESTVLLASAGIAVSAMVARYGLEEYRKYQVSSQFGLLRTYEQESAPGILSPKSPQNIQRNATAGLALPLGRKESSVSVRVPSVFVWFWSAPFIGSKTCPVISRGRMIYRRPTFDVFPSLSSTTRRLHRRW